MEGGIKTIGTIETNSKSVATLTLGILSIIIPVIRNPPWHYWDLVLSRASISEINSTNEAGRGFATAGGICSIVGFRTSFTFRILIFYALGCICY